MSVDIHPEPPGSKAAALFHSKFHKRCARW